VAPCRIWLVTLLLVVVASPSPAASADLDRGADAYVAGNYALAFEEWKPIADAGGALAQHNLAMLYEEGQGVPQDLKKAAALYAGAADQGLAASQYEIGNLHLKGFYGAPNRAKAVEFFWLAADQNYQKAVDKLDELGEVESDSGDEPEYAEAELRPEDLDFTATSSGRCPKVKNRKFKVTVTVDIPRAPIDHSQSIAQLNRNPSFHDPNLQVRGVAVPELDMQTFGSYASMPFEGKKCFWVEGIRANMIYRSLKIFIASEYKKGSCEYRQILRHEKEHVENARLNLVRFEPRIRAALRSQVIPKASQPRKIGLHDDPEAEMLRLYEKLLYPVQKDMLTALDKAQSKIDSPESYAKVQRKCRNW
jgi:hypothetical protein